MKYYSRHPIMYVSSHGKEAYPTALSQTMRLVIKLTFTDGTAWSCMQRSDISVTRGTEIFGHVPTFRDLPLPEKCSVPRKILHANPVRLSFLSYLSGLL